MKRILIITGITLLVLLAALFAAPFLFKDKIRAFVDQQIKASLNAHVYYGDVGLSFIRNFPNARISIENYGVVGVGVFDRDTLIQGERFNLVVDLWSVVSGGEIRLRKVILDKPNLNIITLKDGSYNYDIMKPDTSAQAETADSSTLQIALNEYRLNDATIRYDDATFPMTLKMEGVQHRGTGNMTLDVYELDTETEAKKLFVSYDGITYFKDATASAYGKIKVAIAPLIRMDFYQDKITINELSTSLDGWFEMPGEDMVFDMKFAALPTTFKSLLSIVPGAYTEDFKDVKAEGGLVFDGFVKGRYTATQLPGYGINLKVDHGTIQYPGLPTPVTNLNLDLSAVSPEGEPEKTTLNLRRLHADLGSNPIDAELYTTGLTRIYVKGKMKAKINLEEITRIFPVEGTTLKGLFAADGTVEGVYDEKAGAFPKVSALMSMENGYLKQAQYPAEVRSLNFHARLDDADGKLSTAVFDMPDFRFDLDGEPLEGKLHVENFDDPAYSLQAKGRLDLEKLTQVYPLDSMTLKGKIRVDEFSTSGRYSDVEAGRYTSLPTSGRMQAENIFYSDYDMPDGVTISSGAVNFTPERLELTGVKGGMGSSDFSMEGYLSNYLAYALLPDQPLKGDITLSSRKLDLNSFMASESAPATTPAPGSAPSQPLEAFPVPAGLDIGLNADIQQLIYDKLTISNLKGRMAIADQTVNMNDLVFGMLGANVQMSGTYDSKDLRRPGYSFYLNLKQMAVKNVFTSFSSIAQLAPALEFVDGICNTEFGISGRLRQDMTPVLEEITSLGAFQMLSGGIKNTPLLTALADKTKIPALAGFDLNDISGQFSIENGYLNISPVNLKVKDIILTIGGRQNISGALDYTVKIDAPSTQVDQAALGALSNLSGVALQTSDRVLVNLKVGGTAKSPSVSGAGGGSASQVKDQLVDAAEDKLNDALGTDLSLNKDSLRAKGEEIKQQAKDTLKAVADNYKQQAADSLKNAGDRIKQQAGQQAGSAVDSLLGPGAQDQLKNLKDKFGLPKKKKGGGL